mmetsp:Transcript_70797/g.169493  ORF Transcript_70797/g.169493 Transcript_70797/m.169493 type:complete len:187 (-) Transcript_70797:32-592(-)
MHPACCHHLLSPPSPLVRCQWAHLSYQAGDAIGQGVSTRKDGIWGTTTHRGTQRPSSHGDKVVCSHVDVQSSRLRVELGLPPWRKEAKAEVAAGVAPKLAMTSSTQATEAAAVVGVAYLACPHNLPSHTTLPMSCRSSAFLLRKVGSYYPVGCCQGGCWDSSSEIALSQRPKHDPSTLVGGPTRAC